MTTGHSKRILLGHISSAHGIRGEVLVKSHTADPADIAAYMRPKMLKVFPQLANVKIDYQWGGMIGIGANRLPQIGKLKDQPNVFYAQAYSGHGVNATHLAGKLLGEAIALRESRGFELFAQVPHMTFPGGKYLRSPLLALGMGWYRLKEAVGLV